MHTWKVTQEGSRFRWDVMLDGLSVQYDWTETRAEAERLARTITVSKDQALTEAQAATI